MCQANKFPPKKVSILVFFVKACRFPNFMCKILIPQTSCYENNVLYPSKQMHLGTKSSSINVSIETKYFSLHCDLSRIFFMLYLHLCEYKIDDEWGYFWYHTCHMSIDNIGIYPNYTLLRMHLVYLHILRWFFLYCILFNNAFWSIKWSLENIFFIQRKRLCGSMFIREPILEIKRKVSNRIHKSV